jgi:membrane protein YdbS with pleckstrin-like domain
MGVALLLAAILGLLVSVRYLLLAYLLRDRELALIAVAALIVFVVAGLVVIAP